MKFINNIGIVGAGTMGAALAQKFAQEGFKVVLADRALNYVENGLKNIKQMLEDGVKKNVFTQAQIDSSLANLKGTATLSDLKDCDLVIEAIFENFDAKRTLFQSLSEIVSSSTMSMLRSPSNSSLCLYSL